MYGYYYGGMNGMGLLFICMIGVFILGLWAQARVKNTYRKYSQVWAASGVPAAGMARNLLRDNGSPVQVTRISGSLTDNYNPRTGVVSLSEPVYGSSSIAALAVAAHEIGHVMQYEHGYLPIKIRNLVLPVASFGSAAAPYITITGALMESYGLAMLGVYLFLGMLIFQIVTLPVELNASGRALAMLEEGGYITPGERPAARAVLRAAAMTYVVAALSILISFLRLFMIASSSRRRR